MDRLQAATFQACGVTVAVCLVMTLGFGGASVAQAQSTKFLASVACVTGPNIDGEFSDDCWQGIASLSGFTPLSESQMYLLQQSVDATSVRCVYDEQAIYFAFECREEIAHLKNNVLGHDGAVYNDSCIEFFIHSLPMPPSLQMQGQGYRFFHLIFNSSGIRFDQIGNSDIGSWNPDWTVATNMSEDGNWRAEVAIPFSAMDMTTPEDLAIWQIQIGRTFWPNGQTVYSTLFPSEGVYRNDAFFGPLVFVPDPEIRDIQRLLDQKSIIGPINDHFNSVIEQLQSADAAGSIGELATRMDALLAEINTVSPEQYLVQRENLLAQCQTIANDLESLRRDITTEFLIQRDTRALIVSHPAITDAELSLPGELPDFNLYGQSIDVTLCRNEFESASVLIWSPEEYKDVTVRVGALRNAADELLVDAIDVRWVKCWYQGGTMDCVHTQKQLTPELLLKNHDYLQVDFDAEQNILPDMSAGYPDDADILQALTLPADFTQQAWFTVKVPETATPGLYSGIVYVESDSGTLATLSITINVLDFMLHDPVIESGLYTNTNWGRQIEAGKLDRVRLEMRNLLDHGVTLVSLRERVEDLPVVIDQMADVGLPIDRIYFLNCSPPIVVWSVRTVEEMRNTDPCAVYERASVWVNATRDIEGVEEVYLYLMDEARGEMLAAERPLAQAIHDAGGKTWTAAYNNYFQDGGDFIDTAVICGGPSRSLAQQAHAIGNKIYCYANPQAGAEIPETYRRNFGLSLWQADYDGAFDFCWYWNFGPSAWDDFDSNPYRDHNMVYPTNSGLVDTIQWEGWREGVDDCRYIGTLIYWIDQADDSVVAREAQQWLMGVKDGSGAVLQDLDQLRRQAIKYINQCRQAAAD